MARIKLLWKFEFWDFFQTTEIYINTNTIFIFFKCNNNIFDELEFSIFI